MLNEAELKDFLDKRGYILVRVQHFKDHDRIHFRHKSQNYWGNWNMSKGWHIERLEPKHLTDMFPE